MQVVYAGSGQARTLLLVIKQSPLIEIFRSMHVLIQDNFHMLHHSAHHAPPNLTTMIKVLYDGLQKHQAYEQDQCHDIPKLPNHLLNGMEQIQMEKQEGFAMEEGDEAESGIIVEMEDLEV